MLIPINIRQLRDKNLTIKGELSPEQLELDPRDELIHPTQPLYYDLEAQKLERHVLVRGTVKITLECECARCLKTYPHKLVLDQWICHLPLEGEEKALIINDCLDLTPYLREDILLEFPQHPLCEPGCSGLPESRQKPENEPGGLKKSTTTSSAWAELNKLKFEE